MALKIETFSNIKGGNSFFKALTHPAVAPAAAAIQAKLHAATSIAVFDPYGFAEGALGFFRLDMLPLAGIFVQSFDSVGKSVFGYTARPIMELPKSGADLVFVLAFDADRIVQQIRHLLLEKVRLVTLDEMRLPDTYLSNSKNYLEALNFTTNFAFFRDEDGFHTRVTTANYWSAYGAHTPVMHLTLFGIDGAILAEWTEILGAAATSIQLDSAQIRQRFGLGPFTGQLFIHVAGAAGHDVVKYALDTWQEDGPSLSCTHDANAWPADYYAGLPAPRDDETVILWVQNSLPIEIPSAGIAMNLMGDDRVAPLEDAIPPFATLALDVASLLPDARWPQQIEIVAGRHLVRPRYEIRRAGRHRIAHPNVERTDLKPDPAIPELARHLGKGFILPAPLLPFETYRSLVLPTPMARSQQTLPIAAIVYDPLGQEIARHDFGALARRDSVALDCDTLLGSDYRDWGHVELVYDFDAGRDADGWLHALFRYEARESDHAAETSFGAHIFNTLMTWRDEPQSYSGRAPGLTTRLFLRLGDESLDTFCHLIYPASLPWRERSTTDLILADSSGEIIAIRHLRIHCGGSVYWRYRELFDEEDRVRAGNGGYITIRDRTCRLFGYHGLLGDKGRFSLDHMFGY